MEEEGESGVAMAAGAEATMTKVTGVALLEQK
jgi:hypothetical protein